VWAVRRVAERAAGSARPGPPTAFARGYADGWLAFERLAPADSARAGVPAEKRRHAPIPVGWEGAPDAALAGWLATAVPVVRRTGTAPAAPAVVPDRPTA
jgi:hypothetical protein